MGFNYCDINPLYPGCQEGDHQTPKPPPGILNKCKKNPNAPGCKEPPKPDKPKKPDGPKKELSLKDIFSDAFNKILEVLENILESMGFVGLDIIEVLSIAGLTTYAVIKLV